MCRRTSYRRRIEMGPVQKAKREKQFREHIARKNNPVRFALALPEDVKLQDVDWNPDAFERIATWLNEARKRWAAEDDKRRRERLKQVLAAVERDGLL